MQYTFDNKNSEVERHFHISLLHKNHDTKVGKNILFTIFCFIVVIDDIDFTLSFSTWIRESRD